ncbi:hypothetical protein ACFE04_022188 [Oxalis oulophora]
MMCLRYLYAGDPRLWTICGTRMLINEEIHVFDEYIEKFQQLDIKVLDKRVEMGNQLKKAIPMTLSGLLTEYNTLKQGVTYVCTVQVVDIDDNLPWFYQGCKFCTHAVEHHESHTGVKSVDLLMELCQVSHESEYYGWRLFDIVPSL